MLAASALHAADLPAQPKNLSGAGVASRRERGHRIEPDPHESILEDMY
jgi:hypothetical protein